MMTCSRFFMCLLLAVLAAECGKKPPPAKPADPPVTIAAPPAAPGAPAPTIRTTLSVGTTADANADARGQGTSVVVRVYQLRTDAMFNGADFFALYDDEKKVLGPELITRDEFVLKPLEQRTIDVTFSPEARFIGVVAAYRDIRNAQWRAITSVPKRGLTVTVERARVVTAAAN